MTSGQVGGFIRSNVLGLVAIFIALTGTAVAAGGSSGDGPKATASAVTTAKFKKLQARVTALESKATPIIPTSLPPSGPAGGGLAGTYPNPTLAANSVGTTQIQDGAVTSTKFLQNFTLNFDASSITANTCVNAGFSRSGVTTTDEVSMTPAENQPFGIVTQAAAASGSIVMYFCNITTSPIDPPAGDYEFTIIR